jgi:hypothetical protein
VSNLLKEFRSLLPEPPLLTGEVTAINGELRTITLPDGATITARGDAAMGAMVFVRGSMIEGPAPVLPVIQIVI